MHLSGEVPGRIAAALGEPRMQHVLCPEGVEAIDGWAVHEGGRSILDAVGHGLGRSEHALDESRTVLDAYGTMYSATLKFVLNARKSVVWGTSGLVRVDLGG